MKQMKQMKKVVLLAVSMTVVATSMASMAQAEGFYLKANLGLGMAMDTDVDSTLSSNTIAKMTFDNGFLGSLAAGYDFDSPLRMEFEFMGQKNDQDLFLTDTVSVEMNNGDLRRNSFMVNGFYDVDTGSPWTPFAGIGIGWSKLHINDPGFYESDDDDVFTYQFIGGVAYGFSEQWSVDAQYRFIGTSDATIDTAEFDFNSNSVILGLRYNF
jgi:opacity protein-like surface antigen